MTPVSFSVVVATWNRADLLPGALASIEAQTWRDWEAIVVDDGSTDTTRVLMESWTRTPRFRYLAIEHSGIAGARNAGITMARNSWITFLDSDDAFEPDHLERRARLIETNPGVRFIHGGFRLIGPPEMAFVPDARNPGHLIPLSECAVGGTFVVEAEYLRKLGGFPDVQYAMDYELLKKAQAAGPVLVSKDPTYVYIREPGVGECESRRG